MDIVDLPIHSVLKEFYIHDKIKSLYPPQVEVVRKGLFDNKNLLISIPTASGKTLMAELAMLTSIIKRHGKALYIVPLKALAFEKFERFRSFKELGEFNGEQITTAISIGDFDNRDKGEKLGEADIIVVTSEKADSLIRNRTSWIQNVSIVIVDEIHNVGDADRGATLEMVVAKLRRINPRIQIIGLSATIGNPDQLAAWLNAELIVSDWRPTDLKEGVFYNNAIKFHGTERPIASHKDAIEGLVIDMVKEGGQCLVFCSSRKIAESKAKGINAEMNALLDTNTKSKLLKISEDIHDDNDSKMVQSLSTSISCGCAFHHAGLLNEHKQRVESEFKAGLIKVIFCTPTLAAGINLPARRVIVQYKRFNKKFHAMEDIRVMEYKQMAGRAGRPRLDLYGECVLVPSGGKDLLTESQRIFDLFVFGKPENIESGLGNIKHLQIHILSSIYTGFVESIQDIHELLHESFLPYSLDRGHSSFLVKNVIEALSYLIKEQMVVNNNGKLSATPLGSLVARLCINPTSAALIMKGFQEIETKGIKLTDFTLIHLMCMTADMTEPIIGAKDEDTIQMIFDNHKKELVLFEDMIIANKLESHNVTDALKPADIVRYWIDEHKQSSIAEAWRVGEGDVRGIVDLAEWISSAMHQICNLHGSPAIHELIGVLNTRIKYGIGIELMPLIKKGNFREQGIGRARARKLYAAGIKTAKQYEDAIKSDPKRVHAIIYSRGEMKARKEPDAAPKTKPKPPEQPVTSAKPFLKEGQKSFADY